MAFAVPAGVELVQAEARSLGRVCAVVDVIDNVSGLLVGAVAGSLAVAGAAAVRAAVRRHASTRRSPRRT